MSDEAGVGTPIGAARSPLFRTQGAGPAMRCGGALPGVVIRVGRGAGFAFALRRLWPEAGPGAFRLPANPVSRRRVSGNRGDGEGVR